MLELLVVSALQTAMLYQAWWCYGDDVDYWI
jgi:hypothetical protein